jgi:accessory gene regulator B
MFKLEWVATSVSNKLSDELKLDNDKREVIAYGAFALFQTVLSIVLVSLLGLMFGVALEALVISFVVSILRKYSGGVHATTSDSCTLIGTIVFVGLASALSSLSNWISIDGWTIIITASFLWCYYIVFKLAPVESPSKKIGLKKKKKMKKGSIIVISVYVLLVNLFVVLHYVHYNKSLLLFSLCICIGCVWQTFTLTKTGHVWLIKIDKILNYILNLRGGE